MPPFEAFRDAESDYATLAHRLTHWTEHAQRLCRDLGRKRWGDAGYAAEELVAELGSAVHLRRPQSGTGNTGSRLHRLMS
jgi:antirestriction protein ArdC